MNIATNTFDLLLQQGKPEQKWSDLTGDPELIELQKAKERQTVSFRKSFKNHLVFLLYTELVLLFALLAFQGFHWLEFKLNDVAFGIFANGALIQTFILIGCIVRHLFPKQDGESLLSKILSIK